MGGSAVISAWAAILFSSISIAILGIGLYLYAWHRGYVAGQADSFDDLPVGPPWRPPTEADFMEELLENERRKPAPEKYRREP